MANLFILLICTGLFAGHAFGAERTQPVRIGVLTDSWGPTPGVVGLRDGLHELGYKENKDFVIGVRFTQGAAAALPEAARKLVQQGVDILFTNNPAPAKAAQVATSRIPIVFYGAEINEAWLDLPDSHRLAGNRCNLGAGNGREDARLQAAGHHRGRYFAERLQGQEV